MIGTPTTQATHQRLTCRNGRQLAYEEYGDPAGSPALFIHGCLGSRLSAAPFHQAALKQSIRLIAIDKPGFGYSDLQPELSLAEWPDLIKQLVDHLGIQQISILTSSGGTPYGLSCAAHLPTYVTKIIMINPIADVGNKAANHSKGFNNPWVYRLIRQLPGFVYFCLNAGKLLFRHYPEGFIKLVHGREMPYLSRHPNIYKNRKETIIEAVRTGCQGILHELQTYAYPWNFELQKVSKEVIIIQGLLDINQHVADYYTDLLPTSRLITFDQEDHLSLGYNQSNQILALAQII